MMKTLFPSPLRLTLQCLLSIGCCLLFLAERAWAADGTFRATEDWTVTLEYDDFANGFTGVRRFSGRQTGTIVISGNRYSLINKSGVRLSGVDEDLTTRDIFHSSGLNYRVTGDFVFAPAFGASAHGIVFLGGFIVKVPMIDGEVPGFFRFDRYSGSGPLSSIRGGGNMEGMSLTATVTSTLSLAKVVGPPSIIEQPQGQTAYAGQDVTFEVTAGGDGALSYSWRKGAAVVSEGTEPFLHLTNVESSDAGTYSVTVSNTGGKVNSAKAKLTVKSPPPGWQESWESAAPGLYPPARDAETLLPGDSGTWLVSDTVSSGFDCGPLTNLAEVIIDGEHQRLRLESNPNDFGCAENVWAVTGSAISSSFPFPLMRTSEVSFFEQGMLENPEWNGLFGCIVRPCGGGRIPS